MQCLTKYRFKIHYIFQISEINTLISKVLIYKIFKLKIPLNKYFLQGSPLI